MSYIDSMDYEFVGYFGGIPVYHPLDVLPGGTGNAADFACGPENLVIGGGSGERRGIVVKSPAKAVGYFVHAWYEWHVELKDPEFEKLRPDVEVWLAQFGPGSWVGDWREVLDFAGWDAEYFARFVADCRSGAFVHPYRDDQQGHVSLETWLAASVGEFVVLAMPELAPELKQSLEPFREHMSKTPLYCNILLVPPGYAVWGRKTVNERVVWGNSAWRIQRAN